MIHALLFTTIISLLSFTSQAFEPKLRSGKGLIISPLRSSQKFDFVPGHYELISRSEHPSTTGESYNLKEATFSIQSAEGVKVLKPNFGGILRMGPNQYGPGYLEYIFKGTFEETREGELIQTPFVLSLQRPLTAPGFYKGNFHFPELNLTEGVIFREDPPQLR